MDNDDVLIAIKGMFDANMDRIDKLENKFDDTVEEIKRHTEVLVEDLRKDVKAIAEGHSILNDKMDRLDTKGDRLETKVDKLDIRVGRLETKVDRLETDMSIVKDYVIGVDKKLNEHELILKRVK